jgi:hypothetical protein
VSCGVLRCVRTGSHGRVEKDVVWTGGKRSRSQGGVRRHGVCCDLVRQSRNSAYGFV